MEGVLALAIPTSRNAEIRKLVSEGKKSRKEVAILYGISYQRVSQIVNPSIKASNRRKKPTSFVKRRISDLKDQIELAEAKLARLREEPLRVSESAERRAGRISKLLSRLSGCRDEVALCEEELRKILIYNQSREEDGEPPTES